MGRNLLKFIFSGEVNGGEQDIELFSSDFTIYLNECKICFFIDAKENNKRNYNVFYDEWITNFEYFKKQNSSIILQICDKEKHILRRKYKGFFPSLHSVEYIGNEKLKVTISFRYITML